MHFQAKTISPTQLNGPVDAATVKGSPVSATPAANAIPVLDANGTLNAFIPPPGGDVTGPIQGLTVQGIQGVPLASSLPQDNQIPAFNNITGLIEWVFLTTDQQGGMVVDQHDNIVTAL